MTRKQISRAHVLLFGVVFGFACADRRESGSGPDSGSAPGNRQPVEEFSFEGEAASGSGTVMTRSNASGARTRWLHAGESASWSFTALAAGDYTLTARYSNDGGPALESVQLLLDGGPAGAFDAENTRDSGAAPGTGWNVFFTTPDLGVVNVLEGTQNLEVDVTGGDGFGLEIDWVKLSLTN